MGSRIAIAAYAAASAVVLLGACSSSSYAEAEGSEGGPCYPNGTCNLELVCASGRCVRFDVASDGGGDGNVGSNDASNGGDANQANDASDGGLDAGDADTKVEAGTCTPPSAALGVTCEDNLGSPVACAPNNRCCVDTGTCAASCGGVTLACTSPSDCGGTEKCCAKVGLVGLGCPLTLSGFQGSACKASCGGGEVSLCWGGGASACSGGQECTRAHMAVDFKQNGSVTNVLVGACHQ